MVSGFPLGNNDDACGTIAPNRLDNKFKVSGLIPPGLNMAVRTCRRSALSAVNCEGVGVTPVNDCPKDAIVFPVFDQRVIMDRSSPPVTNSAPGTGRHASCNVLLLCVHTPIAAAAAIAATVHITDVLVDDAERDDTRRACSIDSTASSSLDASSAEVSPRASSLIAPRPRWVLAT